MHVVEYNSYSSVDESTHGFTVEFVRSSKAKSSTYPPLESNHRNQQEDIKFTI